MRLFVSQEALLKAVQTAGEVALKGPTEQQRRIRLYSGPNQLAVMAVAGIMATSRNVELIPPTVVTEQFDVCVQGDRLVAGCKALRKGEVAIESVDGSLVIEQVDGVKIELEQMSVAEFPQVPPFDKMQVVYSGPNPAPGFEAIKHVAAAHPGTTPLSTVLIMLAGRSYLTSQTSSVRCDFSLVDKEDVGPVPIILDSTWVLTHFGKNVVCYYEPGRILVDDGQGWAVILLWSGTLGNFPTKVETTFASLKQIALIKVPRADVVRAASAAQTVLKGTTKDPIFATIKTKPGSEQIQFSANVGRHSYKETLYAWSSCGMEIPIHIGRFAEFLKGSEDEAVYIKVMSSDIVPNAEKKFIHLVDSRLHEVVGLPGEYANKLEIT